MEAGEAAGPGNPPRARWWEQAGVCSLQGPWDMAEMLGHGRNDALGPTVEQSDVPLTFLVLISLDFDPGTVIDSYHLLCSYFPEFGACEDLPEESLIFSFLRLQV